MVAVVTCVVSTFEVVTLPDLDMLLVSMTSLVSDCPGWWLARRVSLQKYTVLVSTIMIGGVLKVTCLLCNSEKFVLAVNLNAGQCWVLSCFPWQMFAVKVKVMVKIFAMVVLF
jgi:hypothetical protein